MDQDQQFFLDHPARRSRIRMPGRQPHIDRQRAVRYLSDRDALRDGR